MAEPSVVLVVDGEPGNRALLRACLEGEHEVREAGNGPEALAICAAGGVDVVVLDVTMPGMSGFDVCRALKGRKGEAFLPVLMLTALDEQEDRNKGLAAGADDFLNKPVNRSELRLRARNFLALRRDRQLLARQYEALRELTALKDDLVTLMVHDLRNPLAGVLGLLQDLERELTDPARRADAAVGRQAAEKLRETLEDVLQVRLLEEGRLEVARGQEIVAPLVEAALASVQGAARLRRLAIATSVPPDLAVRGDGRLLRRALETLLSNAVQHSPSNATIEVQAGCSGSGVDIQVADRGGGVPPERRDQLLETLGGAHARRGNDRRGFGLGLHFVRLVAEAHGGGVSVADREGGGTVMCLKLPEGTSGAVG